MQTSRTISKFGKIFILIIAVSTIALALVGAPKIIGTTTQVQAATSCPAGMTDAQCLEYLRQQADKIGREKSSLESQLSKEKYNQLNLTQKINYINSQIAGRQSLIQQLELDLETKNVEIRILDSEINTIEDNIATVTQETNALKSSLSKRISLSYKYNRVTTFDLLLSSTDIDSVLRKSKYISEARKQDKTLMIDLNEKMDALSTDQDIVSKKKAEAQEKRNLIESNKSKLFVENSTLSAQKSEQLVLIAESKAKESEYNKLIASLKSKQSSYDNQVTELMMKMFQQGQLGNGTPVSKGQIVGFQGHTGCSFGSHLHYGIATKGSNQWSANVDPFSKGFLAKSGSYVVSSSKKAPLNGGVMTQGFHSGRYMDLVSLSEGNQKDNYLGSCWSNPSTEQCYYAKKGSISCNKSYQGWLPLQGEGAPVYALDSGKVYYGVDSWGGAKYALVDHLNGYISMYVHLR